MNPVVELIYNGIHVRFFFFLKFFLFFKSLLLRFYLDSIKALSVNTHYR